jgi:hypothetical protein
MKRLAVESRLTEKIRDAIRTRYDHDPAFYDYPGPVLFMMASYTCNMSQYFDIDGVQAKLTELKLENYPVEDITACTSYAQKKSKLFREGTHLQFVPVRSFCSSSVPLSVNSLTGRCMQF